MSDTLDKGTDTTKIAEKIGGLDSKQIQKTKDFLQILDPANKKSKPLSDMEADYTKDKIYVLASNLVKKLEDPTVANKGNLKEWNLIDDFGNLSKTGTLNTLYHLSQNPDRNNSLDKVVKDLRKPDGTLNYAKLQNEISSFIDGLNKQKAQSRVDSMSGVQIDEINNLIANTNSPAAKTVEAKTSGETPADQEVTKALSSPEAGREFLNKMFDGKTCFDIPNNLKLKFLTGVPSLGNIDLTGSKVYINGFRTQVVEGKTYIVGKINNITYNGNHRGNYEMILGEQNALIKNIKNRKVENGQNGEANEFPYSQIEVGEYNSNKVFNQMLLINNMLMNQTGWKPGENFSYINYMGARNVLDGGNTLPGYFTKNGKSGDDVGTVNGGGLCASVNTLFRTIALGAKDATCNYYDPTTGTRQWNKPVQLGSSAKPIFGSVNSTNHSEQYYNITPDNPIAGKDRNPDATVFVGDEKNTIDMKAKNLSGKTLYVHMKVSILDSGKPRILTTDKNGNPMPDNMKGLHDNSTTWFNETWIDDKPPTANEIKHNQDQFISFVQKRPFLVQDKNRLPDYLKNALTN